MNNGGTAPRDPCNIHALSTNTYRYNIPGFSIAQIWNGSNQVLTTVTSEQSILTILSKVKRNCDCCYFVEISRQVNGEPFQFNLEGIYVFSSRRYLLTLQSRDEPLNIVLSEVV